MPKERRVEAKQSTYAHYVYIQTWQSQWWMQVEAETSTTTSNDSKSRDSRGWVYRKIWEAQRDGKSIDFLFIRCSSWQMKYSWIMTETWQSVLSID